MPEHCHNPFVRSSEPSFQNIAKNNSVYRHPSLQNTTRSGTRPIHPAPLPHAFSGSDSWRVTCPDARLDLDLSHALTKPRSHTTKRFQALPGQLPTGSWPSLQQGSHRGPWRPSCWTLPDTKLRCLIHCFQAVLTWVWVSGGWTLLWTSCGCMSSPGPCLRQHDVGATQQARSVPVPMVQANLPRNFAKKRRADNTAPKDEAGLYWEHAVAKTHVAPSLLLSRYWQLECHKVVQHKCRKACLPECWLPQWILPQGRCRHVLAATCFLIP